MILVQQPQLHILQMESLSQQIPVLLFTATQNNILGLIQNHTKPGVVCLFWIQRALAHTCVLLCLCHLCFACGPDTSPGMQGELRVGNPLFLDMYSLISYCDIKQITVEKGNQESSNACTAGLQGMLQSKSSATATVHACRHCCIL